jgi:hypothetical protein
MKILYIISVLGLLYAFIRLEIWLYLKWRDTMKEIKVLRHDLQEDEKYFKRTIDK